MQTQKQIEKEKQTISRIINKTLINVNGAVEDQHENMWELINKYVSEGIQEAYDSGNSAGYSEGYNEAKW